MSEVCVSGSAFASLDWNSVHFRWNALPPVDSSSMTSAAMMFSAATRPAPLAAKNASVAAAVFANSTMAAPSTAPKTMPDVSAAGCDGNSGNNSLATITASHSGIVWNFGAFSRDVRVSRTRSMTSPSGEKAVNAARGSDACDGWTAVNPSANSAADEVAMRPDERLGATSSATERVVGFASRRPCAANAAVFRVDRRLMLGLDAARHGVCAM
mmetsp:Transcript_29/g.132  ORF Transcript_29/g.132 Transcript_29/m.132 type:complete len:213 (-) Transcript_29:79-717(-)